jgi:hypothetical protein
MPGAIIPEAKDACGIPGNMPGAIIPEAKDACGIPGNMPEAGPMHLPLAGTCNRSGKAATGVQWVMWAPPASMSIVSKKLTVNVPAGFGGSGGKLAPATPSAADG